jgi:hemolysin activation/secretion protein
VIAEARREREVGAMKKRGWKYILGVWLGVSGVAAIAAASETAVQFDVWEYAVDGNSVLTVNAIEKALLPHLGPKKNLDDVEHARKSLEEAYRNAGYATVFVDIPEQEVNTGVVQLKVTEGRVAKVSVTGSRYFLHAPILGELPSLAEGTVPYLPDVEKQLINVNRNPNRFVTPVLKPGLLPGEVEAEFKVTDQLPMGASVELNDRYSPNTSKTRANFGFHYDNLWQREHSFSLQYQTSPDQPDEISVYSSSYMMPIRSLNGYVVTYAVKSDSDIKAVADAGNISVFGKGRIVGARFIRQFEGTQQFFHSLSLGADYKDFEDSITVQNNNNDEDQEANPAVSYVPFTLGYNGSITQKSFTTRFDATSIFGLRGVSGSDDEFEQKRAGAKANYALLRLTFDHQHTLPANFGIGSHWLAQASSGPLISNEQISAGGADTVRGYLESERVGDDALMGSVQLNFPNLLRWAALQESKIFAFAEGAWLRVRDSLPGEEPNFTLASFGMGTRVKAFKTLELWIDWAQAREHGIYTQSRDDRTHAKLIYAF